MTPEFQFQPYTTRYKPQNAYWLAKVAQLAYARQSDDNPAPNKDFILRELQAWHPGFSEVITFNHKSTQAFIAKHEGGGAFGQGFVIIAFRGTDQKEDWLDNLNLFSVDFPRGRNVSPLGKVHSGFYQAFLDVWEEKSSEDQFTMKEVLEREDYSRKAFWVTGHSLGGALASICGFNFIYEDVPFYGIYTYGQPRSCDRTLMRLFNMEAKSRYFRFQNNNDVVTRIPQRLAGYTHVGTFMYLDVDKKLHTDMSFWFQLSDQVDGAAMYLEQLAEFQKAGPFFRDHNMSDYIHGMEINIDFVPKDLV